MTLKGLREWLDEPKRREIIRFDNTELKDSRAVATGILEKADKAPKVKTNKTKDKPTKDTVPDRKCYACNESGHMSPKCPYPEKKKAYYDLQAAKSAHVKSLKVSVNKLQVAFGSSDSIVINRCSVISKGRFYEDQSGFCSESDFGGTYDKLTDDNFRPVSVTIKKTDVEKKLDLYHMCVMMNDQEVVALLDSGARPRGNIMSKDYAKVLGLTVTAPTGIVTVNGVCGGSSPAVGFVDNVRVKLGLRTMLVNFVIVGNDVEGFEMPIIAFDMWGRCDRAFSNEGTRLVLEGVEYLLNSNSIFQPTLIVNTASVI
jgi:hypothetical protein